MRENSSGQRELRGTTHQIHRLFQLAVWIHVDAQNWAEDFFSHDFVVGIFRLDDGGFNEVASAKN